MEADSLQSKVILDGHALSPDTLLRLGKEDLKIELSPDAWEGVEKARQVIDDIVASKRVVYGINTGFGKFESTIIPSSQVKELQINLIRSHCAGVGQPLPPHRARMLLALRINVMSRGHSGIRPSTLRTLVAAFNAGVVPYVPLKGTVGASGDLAPLSHLALGMVGEGVLATVVNPVWRPAADVLKELGIEPIQLEAKEGLAMINGTQFIASLGSEALVRARRIARQADIVCAMSYEALQCTVKSLDPLIHSVRPHNGQNQSASRIRSVLDSDVFPSEIRRSHSQCSRVQDAYSLRCAPQVHGFASDFLEFAYKIMTTELNSATDNPLVFADSEEKILSGGNFHGEYPAKTLDMLAIAIHELGNISERRTERMNNPALSQGLPAFLTKQGGLNSGFMIAHCTAAALVSENKVFCHPASVDSISTSAAQEDHVSMGGMAARKALKVVENVETILAIELLCACQAIDHLRPKRTTEPLEAVYNLVRSFVPPWNKDRNVSIDIDNVTKLLQDEAVWQTVEYAIPRTARLGHSLFASRL